MAADENIQPDGSIPQKPTIVQTIGAAILGMIAVKIATYVVTTLWRLVTREDPPQIDMAAVSVAKKATWVGLVGAASGAARQAARDIVKPPTGGAA